MRASVLKPKQEKEKEDAKQAEVSSSGEESDSSERKKFDKIAKKKALQVEYLENENLNLVVENEDLNTTLKINKDIIKTLLQGD